MPGIRNLIYKNDRYGNFSTQWTHVSVNFTVQDHGISFVYDEIETPLADMCLSKIPLTQSV